MKKLREIEELLAESVPEEAVVLADPDHGIFGDYITGQYAMQKANEIFDLDGIADIDIYDEKIIDIGTSKVFVTNVCITFIALDDNGDKVRFSRIGRGVGIAQARSGDLSPQQIDTALKASLTDGIKNALMRTGRALGAELYFNERVAQVLGWEGGSSMDRPVKPEDELEALGSTVCKYGFGKDKSFKGMTIEDIWNDPDGRKIFDWAEEVDAHGWFNEKLRRYRELMHDREEELYAGDMEMMWFGEERPANARVTWPALVANKQFADMLAARFNPEGKIRDFGPNHPRVKNHLKRHFHVDSGAELTWHMLNALVTYCKHGADEAAARFPEFYTGDREVTDKSKREALYSSPPVNISPTNKPQKVPSGLQVMAREAGIEDPDGWMWSVIGEKATGWTNAHTDLMAKIIFAVKAGTVDGSDMDMLRQLWNLGLSQLS